MKTKYVKVPVSERLPEPNKNKILISSLGTVISGYRTENNNWLILGAEFLGNIEYWLEEKEDHSEKILSLLQRILDLNVLPAETDDEVISLTLKAQGYDMNQINEISQNGFECTKQLINKVKDNGK